MSDAAHTFGLDDADSKAAEAYRLSQARQIIRLELTVVKQESGGSIKFLPNPQPRISVYCS